MSESEKVKEDATNDEGSEDLVKDEGYQDPSIKSIELFTNEGNDELSNIKDSEGDKEKKELTPEKGEEPAPKPQRKPRLNRRSFYLSSGLNGSENTQSQKDTDSSQKKTISLNSVKSSPFESKSAKAPETSKKIILKKTTCDVNIKRTSDAADVSKSSEPQPKKKHKPITWP